MKRGQIIKYYDEINDDFAGTNINPKEIKDDFNYFKDNSLLWRVCALFVYYIIAKPIVAIWMLLFRRYRIKNKRVLKRLPKRGGYFIYANHTNLLGDAFMPNILTWRKNHIITSPDATSIPFLGNLVMMLGAIPLPATNIARKNFFKYIETRIKAGRTITIYPEAHIWPYYTKIRNFPSKSFHFPIKYHAPCIVLTSCYTKRIGLFGKLKKPKLTLYLDGPFYPDYNLSLKEAKEKLRNQVYRTMVYRSNKYSNFEYYKYVKTDNPDDITVYK